jgi:hypothetical protein
LMNGRACVIWLRDRSDQVPIVDLGTPSNIEVNRQPRS